MSAKQDHLLDRLAHIDRDLEELDQQVACGEIETSDAAILRATYGDERAEVRAALEADQSESTDQPGNARRWVGAAALLLGLAALTWGVAASVTPRSAGENLTGGVVRDVVAGEGVDLSQVTNAEMEDVVAANPDVVGMRLALARRYLEAADYQQAFRHYFTVLEQEGPISAEALAAVGWITFLQSDEDAVAASYLERALEIDPERLDALWWLANVRVYGTGQPDLAVPLLERILEQDGLEDEAVAQVTVLLDEARTSG